MRIRRGILVAVVVAAIAGAAVTGGAGAGPAAARVVARPMIVIEPADPTVPAGTIRGYGPSDLRSAYGLEGSSGQGRLVARVDPFDDPNPQARPEERRVGDTRQ